MTEEDNSLSADTMQTTLSDFLNKILAQIATIVFMAAFLNYSSGFTLFGISVMGSGN